MLYIAATKEQIVLIRKKAGNNCDERFSFTETEGLSDPIVCTHSDGKLVEWFRGMKPLFHFIRYGYVFFERKCPYRIFGSCKGQKCQLFIIENFVGDCSIRWSAITHFSAKKRSESN